MKKLLALLLAVVMVVGLMAACNKTSEDTKATTEPTQGGSAEQTQPTEATTEATEPLPGYMDAAHPERYGGHLNVRICTPPHHFGSHSQGKPAVGMDLQQCDVRKRSVPRR